tara:strand:+ start:119 stop:1801 length:1683 start_codon:yes stop_codon:yes gene_type:complete
MRLLFVILMLVVPGLCAAEEKCRDKDRADILLVLDSVVKATRLIEPDEADWILMEAASYQACFRNYEQARKLASQIQDAEDRSYAFFSIAISYARHGDYAQAISLAASTTRKSEVLEKIAVCQAEQGDYAGAQKTIDLITEDLVHAKDWIVAADWVKTRAILEVAILQAKAGNQNASLKTIDRARNLIQKYYYELSVVGKVAQVYAYAGDQEEGPKWFYLLKKFIEPENDALGIHYMVKDVALGYATARKYDIAFQIVKEFTDPSDQEAAIHDLGVLLLSKGDEERATALLSIPEEKWWRDDLLFELVKWSVEQRQPAKALKYAGQLDTDSTQLRIQSLLKIALLQQTLKQPLEAEKTAQQAHQLIESVKGEKEFAELLTEWAQYQLLCKNIKGASRTLQEALSAAKTIEYTDFSAGFHHPLHDIFRGQVQVGDIAGARETLSFALEILPQLQKAHAGFPVYVSNLKPNIVACYVEIGDLDTALKITNAEKYNDSCFTKIGETLGRKGDLAAAVKWCQQSLPDTMKAQVLIYIARGAIKSKGCNCDDSFQRIWENATWAI